MLLQLRHALILPEWSYKLDTRGHCEWLKSMSNSITWIKSQVHITNRHMKQKEIKIYHLLFLWSISIFTVLWSPFIGSLIVTPDEQNTILWAEHEFILQALCIYVPVGHIIFHMLKTASRESFCRDLHLESCLPWTTAIRAKKGAEQCGSRRTGPNPTPCFGLFSSEASLHWSHTAKPCLYHTCPRGRAWWKYNSGPLLTITCI